MKYKQKFKKLYKNWTVHNIAAHPISEILLITSRLTKKLFDRGETIEIISYYIHETTIPNNTNNFYTI